MQTGHIEDLLSENDEALKTVDKAIEGLEHMDEQEDLKDLTEQQVQHLQSMYETRRELHDAVAEWAAGLKKVIEDLLADGYPEEPMVEVDHEVTDDLDQNFGTIEYARSRFKVRPLTTTGIFEARPQQAPSFAVDPAFSSQEDFSVVTGGGFEDGNQQAP